MNKEQIDAVIKIILDCYNDGQDDGIIIMLNELNKICGSEEAIKKTQHLLEQFSVNKEILYEDNGDIAQLYVQMIQEIQLQIPEELLKYFYTEAYRNGINDVFELDGEKEEIAKIEINNKLDGISDDEKLEMFKGLRRSEGWMRTQILDKLSDSQKKQLAEELQADETMQFEIIEAILNQEERLKCALSLIEDEEWLTEIIQETQDVDINLKIKALKKVTSYRAKIQILEKIESPKEKLRILLSAFEIDVLQSDFKKFFEVEFVKEIDEDDLKIKALKVLGQKGESDKVKIIKTIKDPKKRLSTALEEILNDDLKLEFINEIKNPEERREVALKNLSPVAQLPFIKEIPDEDKRIEYATRVYKNFILCKIEVIKTIKDPVKRVEIVFKILESDGDKAEIIKEIQDEELKIKALEKIQEDDAKLKIIKTIKNSSERIENALTMLNSDIKKFEIIEEIEEEKLKLGALKGFQSSSYKLKILKTIENNIGEAINLALNELTVEDMAEFIRETEIDNPESYLKKDIIKYLDAVKAELIKKIKEPDLRLNTALTEINNDAFKVEFIEEIKDPGLRLKIALKEIKREEFKVAFIRQIDKPQERLDVALRELKSDGLKLEFINEIEDPEKRREIAVRELNADGLKLKFINEIEDPEKRRVTAFRELKADKYKIEFIKEIQNPEQRLKEAFKALQEKNFRIEIINEIDNSVKIGLLEKFEGNNWLEIAVTLDDETKFQLLDNIDEQRKLALSRTITKPELVLKAIDKLEIEDKYKEYLKRLHHKNNDVLKNIDLKLLDDYYTETLGEDKINLISCYPEIQEQILKLDDKKYRIILKMIDRFIQQNETDEWTVIADRILKNMQKGQYDDLISNIEDIERVDIEKLSRIMQMSNDFDIKTAKDIQDYEEIKRKKCDEIIAGEGSLKENKNAVFLKVFGQNIEIVEEIIKKFGQDIQALDDGYEKYYLESLKAIMETDNIDILRQIYAQCDEIELIDTTAIIRNLKTAYGKKFNEGLYTPKEGDIIKEDAVPEELKDLGVNVYDAGTDLKMIITSVAPFVKNNPEDFKKDWNRPALASQHFCASYIRNDMLGAPPIPHLCYGFSQMKEDSLMLSGAEDIYSSGGGEDAFISYAQRNEVYYSPDKQIDKTERKYNEMDFRRIQGGEKKQPDYIVAFKRNGKIDNIEKIVKAVKDWDGKVPIVIVDVDKCLENERKQVVTLMAEYNAEQVKAPQKARQILQKVRNNRMTEGKFCLDLEEELKQIEAQMNPEELDQARVETKQEKNGEVSQDDLRQIYGETSAQDRKDGVSELKKLRTKLQEIVKRNEGGDIEQ